MHDKSLQSELLPAELIIQNFVKGESKCNYEFYLRELVNNSLYFLAKSNLKNYCPPSSESHGECDCVSDAYKMDFKLIASKTILQARSVLSAQKDVMADGVVMTSLPKKEYGEIQATRLHAALREYDYLKLCELQSRAPKKQGIENDIYELLETLETQKNLLLFFPYRFYFEQEYELNVGSAQIAEALSDDFQSAMEYRHEKTSGYDTYMCFIYNGHVIFMQENDNRFTVVDSVKLNKSPTYCRLLEYTDIF